MDSSHSIQPIWQITLNQHIFPRSVLSNFLNQYQKLEIFDIQNQKNSHVSTKSPMFVVNRAWDQRTESGTTVANIETQFGKVAKRLRGERSYWLDDAANRAISAMYSLWRVRQRWANLPMPEFCVGLPERLVSESWADESERYGVISIRENGKIPGRQIAGVRLLLELGQQINNMAGKKWGIVRARAGQSEFVLPDSFGDVMVMPLSPSCCLIADEYDGVLSDTGISDLNALAQRSAKKYLAARLLSVCPGLSHQLSYKFLEVGLLTAIPLCVAGGF